MPNLNRAQLANGTFAVAHTKGAPVLPVNILQFGEGNFLRAFFDWMVDIANEKGVMRAGIAVAQPLATGKADVLAAQDNLYTVLLRGIQNGQAVSDRRVVSCLSESLNPYASWTRMVEIATSTDLRFIVSNTTEAGIAEVEEPFTPDACPKSFPAKVAVLLYARYKAFAGAADRGLIIMPCELIEENGTNLKRIVLAHAKRWNLEPGFAAWVEAHNTFVNTLVDRIVPGYPADEAPSLFAAWGYEDPMMVAAEPFHVWVIEGPAHLADALPLHKAGANVVWTNDLRPYRTRKVRILNGAHTGSALAAFAAGIDTVKGMTDDTDLGTYLKGLIFDCIVPYVPLPEEERQSFARTILERFANPSIRHALLSISLNSVSKWAVRVLPTVKDWAAEKGMVPAPLAFSLAALIHFYKGELTADGYVGRRGDETYVIRDDKPVIEALAKAWSTFAADPAALTHALLADASLWGEDLTVVADLEAGVAKALGAIESQGVRAAVAALNAG